MSIMAFNPIGRRTVQALSKQMTQERFLNPFSCGGLGRHYPVGGHFDLPLLYVFSRTKKLFSHINEENYIAQQRLIF